MTGRFTEDAMANAMRQVAKQLDVANDDATLLRLTNNAVYALPGAGLVIRITRSHGLPERVRKVVALAQWFAHIDAPTIRLAAVPQPIIVDGLPATAWIYLPQHPPQPTVDDLGPVLRRFHHLGTPPMPLQAWDPVGDARARLADAEALAETDRHFLLDWCDRLQPQINALNAEAGTGLLHGDAHAGNLLRRRDGQVVLCDFDATCLGPWQVDLVAVAVGEVRFGRAGAHATLATAYGYDVTTDPAWPLLREARELKMVAAAVPLLASAPGVAQEFTTRLHSIQHDDPTARWTPFADLRT